MTWGARSGVGATVALGMFLVVAGGCGPAQTTTPKVQSASAPGDDLRNEHVLLGNQYLSSKLPLKAADEFRKALEIDPENPDLYARLGYAYLESGDFEKAIKTYQRSVDLEPKNCKPHASLAFAYLRQELTDQAIVEYEKALRLCPEDPNAYNNLGQAYLKAGYEIEAIEAIRRAIELNPDDIRAYETLARVYWDRKLFPEAIAAYEAILRHPDNGKDDAWVVWASGRLAFMYKWAGAYEKAIPHYKRVVEAEPSNVRAIRGLAVSYEKTEQIDLAIRLYTTLLREVPDKPVYYYRLGELLNDVGRYSEAIRRVKEGKAYDTECGAHAHCVIGRAYEKMGGISNYKRAEREFRRALSCNDPNFNDYATKQIDRQQQLIKIEELKKQKEKYGY